MEHYLTFRYDHDGEYDKYLTNSLVDACGMLFAYKNKRMDIDGYLGVCIEVYKRKLIYRQSWLYENIPDSFDIMRNIQNKEDKFWNC